LLRAERGVRSFQLGGNAASGTGWGSGWSLVVGQLHFAVGDDRPESLGFIAPASGGSLPPPDPG
jgi:hypothetical protein